MVVTSRPLTPRVCSWIVIESVIWTEVGDVTNQKLTNDKVVIEKDLPFVGKASSHL